MVLRNYLIAHLGQGKISSCTAVWGFCTVHGMIWLLHICCGQEQGLLYVYLGKRCVRSEKESWVIVLLYSGRHFFIGCAGFCRSPHTIGASTVLPPGNTVQDIAVEKLEGGMPVILYDGHWFELCCLFTSGGRTLVDFVLLAICNIQI